MKEKIKLEKRVDLDKSMDMDDVFHRPYIENEYQLDDFRDEEWQRSGSISLKRQTVSKVDQRDSLRSQFEEINEEQMGDDNLFSLFQSQIHGYSKEARKKAAENIENLFAYYKKYCEMVDADLIATDEEKLVRKWDPLRSCERDLMIYLNYKGIKASLKQKNLSADDQYLLDTYKDLRGKMFGLNKNKPQSQKKPISNEKDALTKDQMAGIARVDTWLIRNFRNGGAMAFTGAVCNRVDIVGKLLAMPPRKRLYIYYLIEHKERTNPTREGFMTSQIVYTPDVGVFKDRMIATPWKFYKRFSGGYIYWNKLTEAMGIADQVEPLIEHATRLLLEEEEERKRQEEEEKKEDQDNNIINQNEIKKDKKDKKDKEEPENIDVDKTLRKLVRLMLLKKAGKKNKHTVREKDVDRLVAEIESDLQKLNAASGEDSKDMVKAYTVKLPSNVNSVGNIVVNTVKNPTIDGILHLKGKALESFTKHTGQVLAGMGGIASLAGSLFEFSALKSDVQNLSKTDRLIKGVNILGGGYKAVRSGTTLAKTLGATGGFVTAMLHNASWYATAGVDAAMALLSLKSFRRGSKHRTNAAKLAATIMKKKPKQEMSKKSEEDRFREGMLALNKKLANRQKKNVMISTSSATISSTAVILTTASVLTAGIGAIVSAVAFGVGIGLSVMDSKDSKRMKMAIFDAYFNVDKELAKAKENWQSRNQGKVLTPEQEKLMKEQLRNRIAAKEGYYSPRHAAKGIAKEYAKYLLDTAHDPGNESSAMCVSMIKGLGLKYNYYINDEKKSIPKESDIVKKLCG